MSTSVDQGKATMREFGDCIATAIEHLEATIRSTHALMLEETGKLASEIRELIAEIRKDRESKSDPDWLVKAWERMDESSQDKLVAGLQSVWTRKTDGGHG